MVVARRGIRQGNRHPKLHARWIVKAPGHYADHTVRLAIKRDGFSEYCWVGLECAAPELIAQYHYFGCARTVFLSSEGATEFRCHSEYRKIVRREIVADEELRISSSGECHFVVVRCRDILKRRALLLPFEIVARRHRRFVGFTVGIHAPDHCETAGVFIRQICEQNRIHDREYRCARADSEREREHGDGGEAGGFTQHAYTEAGVLEQLLQPNETPHGPRLFLHQRHVTELSHSRETRFLRRHTTPDVVLCFSLDVIANVLVEFLQHAFTQPHCWPSCSLGRRYARIAPASLPRLWVSTAICRRPLRRQPVKLGPAIVLRGSFLDRNPSPLDEPVQCRV